MTDQPSKPPQAGQNMDTLRKNLKAETHRLAAVHTAPVETASDIAGIEADRAVSEAREEEERKRKWRRMRWVGRMMGISAAT
ncbi:hypothetical protein VE02_04071 [Pseudogymnoascus sp. 03VT05]|nr:hypothetical protein VE02_04071 [Pseudogymnoascus sp. 03VT05]